jgi:RNA-binding protein
MRLDSKQRAVLRGLGQKMEPIIWVGKGGITPAVGRSVEEALTARELVKGKVQPEAGLSAMEAGEELAEICNAIMVGSIGRTFLLYRRDQENPRIL